MRVTFVWGFFRRDSVLDAEVDMPAVSGSEAPRRRRYTAEAIRERAQLVQLAIDARHQHRPNEVPFQYAPGVSDAESHRDAAARREALRGYGEGTIFI